MKDDVIDKLIRPPRQRYAGFDWKQPAEKLKPTGAANLDRILGERFRPDPGDSER